MNIKGKCKKCLSVIEPRINEIISCKCGEITFEGVARSVVCATSTDNYLEVDDQGNEIVKFEEESKKATSPPTSKELIGLLDNMIKSYEELPTYAMTTAVNNYDMLSSLLLFRSLFSTLASETSLIKESMEAAKVETSI